MVRQLVILISIVIASAGIFLIVSGLRKQDPVTSINTGTAKITLIRVPKKESAVNYSILWGAALLIVSAVLLIKNKTLTPGRSNEKELTVREKKIIELMKKSMLNKEIATELNVSLSTVKTHVNNLYKKLNVNSREQLFELLKKQGIST